MKRKICIFIILALIGIVACQNASYNGRVVEESHVTTEIDAEKDVNISEEEERQARKDEVVEQRVESLEETISVEEPDVEQEAEQEEKFWERIETDEEQATGRYASNGIIEISMERIDKSIYDEQGRLIATIYYDKPVILGNTEAVSQINAFFENETQCFFGNAESQYISEDAYGAFLEGVEVKEERYGLDALAKNPIAYVMNSRISYLDENVLSIFQVKKYNVEHIDWYHYGYTFDLATGEVMPITDMVDITPDEMRKIFDDIIDDEFDLYGELKNDNFIITEDTKTYDMKYQYVYDGKYCYLIEFYGGRNYLCELLVRLEENMEDAAVFTCGTDWDGGDKIWWQKVR